MIVPLAGRQAGEEATTRHPEIVSAVTLGTALGLVMVRISGVDLPILVGLGLVAAAFLAAFLLDDVFSADQCRP